MFFKKKIEDISLATRPSHFALGVDLLESIARKVKDMPINDLTIRPISVDLKETVMTHDHMIELSENPESIVKVSSTTYTKRSMRELIITCIVYFTGNMKAWAVVEKFSVLTKYTPTNYDDEIINIVVGCANYFIDKYDFGAVSDCVHESGPKVCVKRIDELNIDSSVLTTGYVTSYGFKRSLSSLEELVPNYYDVDLGNGSIYSLIGEGFRHKVNQSSDFRVSEDIASYFHEGGDIYYE